MAVLFDLNQGNNIYFIVIKSILILMTLNHVSLNNHIIINHHRKVKSKEIINILKKNIVLN